MDLRTWFDQLTVGKVMNMLGESETQVLDCKRPGDDGSTKRTLAQVVAGFANAEGGVCLWGVDAKKGPDGVDCISGFPGVGDPRQFASRLDELTPQASSPHHPGVLHPPLAADGLPGLVATYVPESDSGPHMARYGEDRYYQRVQSSFQRMEHFQVADMFGRRARPVLEVQPVVDTVSPHQIGLRIRNIGRGVAQAPFIEYTACAPYQRNIYGIDGNRTEHLPLIKGSDPGWHLHAGGTEMVIHPTMSVLVGGVWLGFSPGENGQPLPTECVIEYKVGAIGTAPRVGTLRIPTQP